MEEKKKYIYLVCTPLILYLIHVAWQTLVKRAGVDVWDNYTGAVLLSIFITMVSLVAMGALLGGFCFLSVEFLSNKLARQICSIYAVSCSCIYMGISFLEIPLSLEWKQGLYNAPILSGVYFILWLRGSKAKKQ